MDSTEEQDRAQAQTIAEAIQGTAEVDFPPGTLLVNFVVVADWLAPDGERHLSRIVPPDQPVWSSEGLLAEALNARRWR